MSNGDADQILRSTIRQMIEEMDHRKYAVVDLSKGYNAIVDVEYLYRVNTYNWFAVTSSRQVGQVYAKSSAIISRKHVPLANFVMSLSLHGSYQPSVKHLTFANKISLDCRLENLIDRTGRQSVMRHRLGKSNTTSEFKGVRKRPQKNSKDWRVQIHDGEKTIHLGHYETEEYAAKIYDAAAWILFGASAHYNFPIGTPSSEHRQTARNYIERHLNKRRVKQLSNTIIPKSFPVRNSI